MERVAGPEEPVVAPVDLGSSPSEAQDAFSFSRGLDRSCPRTLFIHK